MQVATEITEVPHVSAHAAVPTSLTEDAFLGGRINLLQPEKGYRAGIDAVFLAATVPCSAGEQVFEAGIGAGAAALCVTARCPGVHLTGIENNARYALLCEENAKRNGYAQHVKVINAELKDAMRRELIHMPQHGSFQHAFANPPFFEDGKVTPSPSLLKAKAHSFGPDDLDLWIKVMIAMVGLRGTVTLIHRPEALGKILASMEEKLGDIRVAPLHAREHTTASRIIVQGVKGSRAPLQLLPGLILHNADNSFTEAADAILREGLDLRLR